MAYGHYDHHCRNSNIKVIFSDLINLHMVRWNIKRELVVKRYCSECQKWYEVTLDIDECPKCKNELLGDIKEEQGGLQSREKPKTKKK